MKIDFMQSFGGGGSLRQAWVERRMRRLDVRPLDDGRGAIRTGVISLAVFVIIFLAFGLLAPISGAAIAEGEVTVAGNRLLVQPEATGIVSQMLVHEGQMVQAGQPLVRMNGMRSSARLRQAQANYDALRAVEARLIAERDGLPALAFPNELASRGGDPAAYAAMRAQQVLFARRQPILAADRAVVEARLDAARAQQESSVTQLRLIRDELAGIRSLHRRGFATITRLRALERSEAQLVADVATGDAAATEATMNRGRTENGQQIEIVQQLAQVQQQLAQVTPELDVTRYAADRDLLRAPFAGRVSGIASIGPGTVISTGRTLMELVPTGRALIIEARVRPQDADDVRVGQAATVHFPSVNPHGRSAFSGRVVTLSPTRVSDGQGPGYFKVQVALEEIGTSSEGITLQPGLPASVHIQTQSRTLFDYLFAPISDAFSRSFREE